MSILSERIIASNNLHVEKNYWRDTLWNFEHAASFPYDYASRNESSSHDRIQFTIDKNTCDELARLSNKSDYRLHALLLAGVSLLLRKYSGMDDLVVVTPIDKQNVPIVSLLNKAIPVFSRLNKDQTIKEVVYHVNERIKEASRNQNYPIDQVVHDLRTETGIPNLALFDVGVVLENIQDIEYLNDMALSLTFSFKKEENNNVVGFIVFNSKKYNKKTIERIAEHLMVMLRSMMTDPGSIVKTVSLLSEAERSELDKHSFGEKLTLDKNVSILDYFSKNVFNDPDGLAVVCGEKQYTFGEVNDSAEKLATYLNVNGIGENEIVGVYANERSADYIIAILAVMKTGNAYVPLDASMPLSRVEYILHECKTRFIVSNNQLKDTFGATLINMREVEADKTFLSQTRPLPHIDGGKLAYVIYTSGTTGNPKGVVVTHGNVINLVLGLNETIFKSYNQRLRLGLISNFIFDASVQCIFGGLLLGNTVVIAQDEEKATGEDLVKYFHARQVDVCDGTPHHLRMINTALMDDTSIALSLKHMIIGGDSLSVRDVKFFFERTKQFIKVSNVYGPTECTVNATYHTINPRTLSPTEGIIPIGVPLPDYTILILDRDYQPVPRGLSGEVFIGGKGVANGYVNPTLNERSFIENLSDGKRYYRTGDRGKWMEDWTIAYLGRLDNQVKVRGYRIELEEIKRALLKATGIEDAHIRVIDSDQDEDKFIVAYYIEAKVCKVEHLRNELKSRLPVYMIPAYFVKVEQWPISRSGKLNVQGLPLPSRSDSENEIVLPKTQTEKHLLEFWQEVLQLERISTTDNFFNIGGDSLKLIRLMNLIKTRLNVVLKLPEIYGNESIEKLATIIDTKKPSGNDESVEVYNELELLKQNILNTI